MCVCVCVTLFLLCSCFVVLKVYVCVAISGHVCLRGLSFYSHLKCRPRGLCHEEPQHPLLEFTEFISISLLWDVSVDEMGTRWLSFHRCLCATFIVEMVCVPPGERGVCL